MRIAYVCADPGVPVFGNKGCSVHVREVVRALRRRDCDVHLFARRLGGKPAGSLKSLPVTQLATGPSPHATHRERFLQQANGELRALVDSAGPFDLVYERYALWSYAALEHARETRIPSVLEVNAPLVEEQAAHRVLVDRAGATAATARAFAAAEHLVGVSQRVVDYVAQFEGAKERVHLVPNGVDTRKFRPNVRAADRAPHGTFTIGFVGSLKPWHGVDELLTAFALLAAQAPKLRLLIVGQGPEQDKLQLRLHQFSEQVARSVRFVGAVAHDAVPGWLASMDVAVAPYPALEQDYFSPLKLYEYMAAGLPIVASRMPQIERMIAHGENGLLYPPGCIHALVAALKRVQENAAFARALGERARRDACTLHSWDQRVSQILQVATPIQANSLASPC